MTRRPPGIGLGLWLALSATAGAAELEDVLSGFESAAEPVSVAPAWPAPPTAKADGARLGGHLGISAVWATSDAARTPGLTRLRARTGLELDADPAPGLQAHATATLWNDFAYALRDADRFAGGLRADMEHAAELGELWLRGRPAPSLDLKVGRQIVVWGKSDNLRVTDVLNPLDNREPGMTDLEDLRLPVAMTRLDAYVGDWNLTLLALHERRAHEMPAPGSDYQPLPALPPERTPGTTLAETEWALAAQGRFSGWDLSLHAARLYDDQFHLAPSPSGPVRAYARHTMAGAAANVVSGNWLWKSELALFDGLRATGVAPALDRADGLLGFEYAGLTDGSLSLEVVRRHWLDHDALRAAAGIDDDLWQAALRVQRDLMNARLRLTLLGTRFGPSFDAGGFTRASAAWTLRDAVTLTFGAVSYHRGEPMPFTAIGNGDRLYAEWRLDF